MDLMDKIGKLLVQAENAATEAEAQVFMDKAYALGQQNAIDLQAARARQADKTKLETPEIKRVMVRSDWGRREMHLAHKCELLIGIARQNNLKVTIAQDNSFVNLFGYPSDIDVAETLYNSLVIQMVDAASKAIKRGAHKEIRDYTKTGHMDARTYRGEFYRGFHQRVENRLRAVRQEVKQKEVEVVSVDTETGEETIETTSGALVLLGRTEEVRAFYEANNDAKGSWKGSKSSGRRGSWRARSDGEDAGQNAVITPAKGLPRHGKELVN